MTAAMSRRREVRTLTATPTVSATPDYADGDAMGALISLTGVFGTTQGGGGLIQSLRIMDNAANGLQIDGWFFDANPAGSTVTDNSALSIVAADYDKVIGRVPVTDWSRTGLAGFAENLAIPFVLPDEGGDTLYLALEARGAHNLGATDDIDIQVGLVLEKQVA